MTNEDPSIKWALQYKLYLIYLNVDTQLFQTFIFNSTLKKRMEFQKRYSDKHKEVTHENMYIYINI